MPSTAQSQAATFLHETADIPSTPKGGFDPEKGMVPFASALKLTYEQEQRMVAHALQRIEQMENEQGRCLVTSNSEWYATSTNINIDRYTWMGRRSIYELNYQNKVWWRKWALGGIYVKSNLTLPFSRSICRQMTAQAIDYFFGTDPWFSASPIGEGEEDLAEAIDEFSQFKTEKSNLKSCGARAIEGAFVRGESVVKTVWEVEEQTYEQFANTLVDGQGMDVLDANKDWIMDKDKFVDEMQSEINPGPGPDAGKPIPGSAQWTGRRVLRKDMQTVEPTDLGEQGGSNYVGKTIRRRKVNFKGARSDVVYWQDFLCPETAPHIQRGGADIVVHLYDMLVIKLIDLYQRRGLLQESPSKEYEQTQLALKALRAAASLGGQAKSAVGQPRADIGERQGMVGSLGTEPKMQIAECYMTFDANEDGETEEIALVVDRINRIPLFYDYAPNVTPDGERPFDVVRVQPIEGRWYGIGFMEIFSKSQRSIDLFYNRWNLSQSEAGRVTFWKPQNTLEGDRNPNLTMNYGQTYTLKKDAKLEDTLSVVTLPEVKGEDLQKIMQVLIQIMTSESGTSNANDAAIAGLDTSKLATGVRNIQQSNDVKTSMYISALLPCIKSIVTRNLKTEFANTTNDDLMRLFRGNEPKVQLILDEDVDDIDLDVDINLSRYRNQQLLASSQGATNSAAQFFAFPPQVQHLVQPLFAQAMRAFGFDDVDAILTPLDEPLPLSAAGPQPSQPQSQGVSPQAGATPPVGGSMSAPSPSAPQIQPNKLLVPGQGGVK